MTTTDGSERFALRDDAVSWTPTDNGAVVVLDLRSSRYLNLNSSASLLWSRVSEGASRDSLASALVDTFGIDSARANDDATTFLDDLRARDLLVAVG